MMCNKCGKELVIKNEIPGTGFVTCSVEWGYPSAKDGENHTFTLCEDCYDEIVREFQIPVDRKERIELI